MKLLKNISIAFVILFLSFNLVVAQEQNLNQEVENQEESIGFYGLAYARINDRSSGDNIYADNIMALFDYVDDLDLNEDQNALLKNKVLFIYKSILSSDSEEAFLNYIVPDFFNFSLCIPYHFGRESDQVVYELLQEFQKIESEESQERYLKVHEVIYSQEVLDLSLEYVNENVSEINNLCYNHSIYSSMEDINTVLE